MNKKKAFFIAFQAVVATVVLTVSAILLLSHFGYINVVKPYIVQSGSMEPVVKVGSVVFAAPSKTYGPGDIISFAAGGDKKRVVTHRIVFKLYPDGPQSAPVYLTSGDANEEFDREEVKNEYIIGKVFLTIPYAGYLADFARRPQGFILLVIVPATIIIYEELKFLKAQLWERLRGFKGATFKGSRTIRKGLPKIAIVFPAIGAAVVVISLSSAFFFDIEKSLANILGAATSFGEETANLYLSDGHTCPGGATDESTDKGTVILKKVGADLEVDVVIVGGNPGQVYDVWVNQDPGACPLGSPTFPGAMTTDGSGNDTFSGSTPLVGTATNFWVSAVDAVEPIQVLRSTAVSFP